MTPSAKKYWIMLGVLVILIVALFAWSPGEPTQQKTGMSTPPPALFEMTIGYLPVPQPVLVAKEKKFFEEETIQVNLVEFPTPNANLEAIIRGDVHGSGSIAYLTLFSFELESPQTITTFFSAYETEEDSWSQLIVKKDRGITQPKDLIGKTVVMRSGLSSKIQADAVFKGMNIDPSGIKYVQVNPELLILTFGNPDVDAFLDIQPFGTILQQEGLGTLFIDHPRATFIQNPYPLAAGILSLSFTREHPEETKRFVTAINRAIAWVETNEEEARKIFASTLKLSPAVAETMPLFKSIPLAQTKKSQIESLAEWAVQYGLLRQKPNFQTFFVE